MDKKNLEKEIDNIFARNMADVLPNKDDFKKLLLSGKKLKFYIGADPTAPQLHLGHAQNLMILEDFRKLGHEVIFLIGDFTAMIGDPDKSAARVRQTREQVEENLKGWKEQTKNILGYDDKENPVRIEYNSKWLNKLNFEEVIDLASNFTVQQMLERDMFEKRIKEGKPVHLHEFLYPLMQGYDSVVLDVDVELCGTDQIFNALAGRTLMQKMKKKDKFVVSMNLIADEKTGMLMSKSNGTGIFLGLEPNDLFGAVMSQPDGMIRPLLIGCTRIPMEEVKEIMELKNPMDSKLRLAHEIVKIYHGEEEADNAKENFSKLFQKKETTDDVLEIKAEKGDTLSDILVKNNIVPSKTEVRRLVKQKAIDVDEETISDVNYSIEKDSFVKVGKKKFLKIVV